MKAIQQLLALVGCEAEALRDTQKSKNLRFQHRKCLNSCEEALSGLLMTPSGQDQFYLIHGFTETPSCEQEALQQKAQTEFGYTEAEHREITW